MILRCFTNQPLATRGKRNVRRCNSIALIVSYDFNLAVFEDTNTRVSDRNVMLRSCKRVGSAHVVPRSMPMVVSGRASTVAQRADIIIIVADHIAMLEMN